MSAALADLCIYAERTCNTLLFHHEGGVDVGDVDAKAARLSVGLTDRVPVDLLTDKLLMKLPDSRRAVMATFIANLYDSNPFHLLSP